MGNYDESATADAMRFLIVLNGSRKVIETDEAVAVSILEFRARFSEVMHLTRLRSAHGDLDDEEYEEAHIVPSGRSLAVVRNELWAMLWLDLFAVDADHALEEIDEVMWEDGGVPQSSYLLFAGDET